MEEDWAAYDARNEMFVAGLDRQGRPSVTWRVSRHEPDQPAGQVLKLTCFTGTKAQKYKSTNTDARGRQTPALGARYLVCTIERARAVNPSSRHIIFICDCSGLQWKNFEHAMFTEAVGMLQVCACVCVCVCLSVCVCVCCIAFTSHTLGSVKLPSRLIL